MILLSWSFGCYSDNNNELPRFLKKTIVVKKGSYLQFKSVGEYYTDKRFLSHDIKQNWNSTIWEPVIKLDCPFRAFLWTWCQENEMIQ